MHQALSVLATAVAIFAFALAVEFAPPAVTRAMAPIVRHEFSHLVLHTALYAALAVALVAWQFSSIAHTSPRTERARRWATVWAVFVCVAVGQELAQALSRHRTFALEELFDLTVDCAAATVGFALWTRGPHAPSWRGPFVARALGVFVHPLTVTPIAVFALIFGAESSPSRARIALLWTLALCLSFAPVAALWLVGMRRRWFADRDLSRRSERPAFLGCALLAAIAFAVIIRWLHAPRAMLSIGATAAVGAALFALVTGLGVKASGHAAVPLALGLLMAPQSARGAWPCMVVAAVIGWARVREGRHSAREVLAGWAIAVAATVCAWGLVGIARWGG
ncbi:MAG: hypothetical protein Q8Q09_11295 [Deltaproteobacteria bacterium]|nr:hypothetical protein [Deltaproteobacteria bacterium]